MPPAGTAVAEPSLPPLHDTFCTFDKVTDNGVGALTRVPEVCVVINLSFELLPLPLASTDPP